MSADKELLKEVALELWNTTKKLRPELPKAPRAQLVLKALMTIGDMSDQLQAAMILGLIEAQEPDDEPAKIEVPPASCDVVPLLVRGSQQSGCSGDAWLPAKESPGIEGR